MKVSTLTYNPLNVLAQYDPTHTLAISNLFTRDLKKRFVELMSVVKKSVYDNDCFGLNKVELNMNQMTPTNQGQFAFLRSEAKVTAFIKWLEEQVEKGFLTTTEMEQLGVGLNGTWTNLYITDSYKRGLLRARAELRSAGIDAPELDASGLNQLMSTTLHADRLGLLYTRVFSDLKGITDAMDSQISRVLTQGMADGDNPRLLARKLVSTINGTGMGDLSLTDTLGRFIPAQRRAEMLARTEIIRAHHQATIQEYMNWRVEKVFILAEIATAGDKRVCGRCLELAKNGPYTLEVAMNLIPNHVSCRCAAIPYLKGVIN